MTSSNVIHISFGESSAKFTIGARASAVVDMMGIHAQGHPVEEARCHGWHFKKNNLRDRKCKLQITSSMVPGPVQ
jgi:hypothetical protein